MKLELEIEDVKSILELIRVVDPTGVFMGKIGKQILKQVQTEASKPVKDKVLNMEAQAGDRIEFATKKV
jgi:DNA-directed RNA polymerase specialized sigma54-like protein